MKKYELTGDTMLIDGKTLYRIKALIDLGGVKSGDLGGYIEKEENLSHSDNAWVYGNARVYGNADYLCFKGLGSANRNTTFFKCKDEHIHVSCGCFNGNLYEFEEKIKRTHRNNKFAKEYLACLNVVKIHFEVEEK